MIHDFPVLTRSEFAADPPDGLSFDAGAVLLVDKPPLWTSFDVVNKLRYSTRARRVGHCGTLDPMATGLLIVCTGRATKIAARLSDEDKQYEGALEFGIRSDTHDREGGVVGTAPVPALDRDDLQRRCHGMTGPIEQIPPQYSALKVKGTPAYKWARQGRVVPLAARSVTVHEFLVLSYDPPIMRFRIHCSKGTYVRSLVRDLGEAVGCGAVLTALRRTRVGSFDIADAAEPAVIAAWVQRKISRHADRM